MNQNKIQMNKTKDQKLPKICLSIIVKNEAPVIERMLESVSPILDYYCIVDTGSTDGTQEIIKNYFKNKGIEGVVIDHEWKNFEDARNTALKQTKEFLANKNEEGFGFWIDADEQLILDKNFDLNTFKRNIAPSNGANTLIHYGGQNYYRMQFFRCDTDWRWYGPVHEVLVTDDKDVRVAQIQGMHVLVTADGNSWVAETIKEKYEGHAKILEDYVANDEKKDPRWLFYLAQSYRDAGGDDNLKKSLEWYEKRIKAIGGYWEEIYFSALMAANIKSKLGYPELEVIESFLKCGKYNIHRIEHLIPVIAYYHSKKEFDLAYVYGLRAAQCDGKLPIAKSSLFVENDVYLWKFYDMHCLSCWYSNRKDEGTKYFKKVLKLMDKGIVPTEHHSRIRENKKYFLNLKK